MHLASPRRLHSSHTSICLVIPNREGPRRGPPIASIHLFRGESYETLGMFPVGKLNAILSSCTSILGYFS